MKNRIIFVFAVFAGLWSLVLLRAAWIQLIPDQRLDKIKSQHFQTHLNLQSRRGTIVDRNGREVATSVTSYSLFVDPAIIVKPSQTARRLARTLDLKVSDILPKMTAENRRFAWIARHLTRDQADLIKSWKIRGLSFVEEFRRVYPNGSLGAVVLGHVGIEGKGLEGLELFYDELLRGADQKLTLRRDARGRPLLLTGAPFVDRPEGDELRLTLDLNVQHFTEQELAAVRAEHDADQAFAVIIDVSTSEIVALANAHRPSAKGSGRLGVVTDTFEPGSVIKSFTIAEALEQNLIAPNTRVNTMGGQMRVGRRIIREASQKHKWEFLTVNDVLAFSSNVGSTQIGFMLKDQGLRRGLTEFGFGSRTQIDFPGEARGRVHPLPWRPHLLSNVSFGHGMTATALQVANAYATIARNGEWRPVRLVKERRAFGSPEWEPLPDKDAENQLVSRQVISPKTATAMRVLLAGVTVPGGTGEMAKIPGFVVAGKTGTAQKVNPQGGGYLKDAYLSSFAGFFPAHEPRYVLYVGVDHPRGKKKYGSQVAAPLFSRLGQYLARSQGLTPATVEQKNFLSRSTRSIQSEEKMTAQDVLPNLTGKSLRAVLRMMGDIKLQIKATGSGTVELMSPAPGTPLSEVQELRLILK